MAEKKKLIDRIHDAVATLKKRGAFVVDHNNIAAELNAACNGPSVTSSISTAMSR